MGLFFRFYVLGCESTGRTRSHSACRYFITSRPLVVNRCVLPPGRNGRLVPAALPVPGGWCAGTSWSGREAIRSARPHLLQRFAQHRPIVGVVVAQERLVQAALPQGP